MAWTDPNTYIAGAILTAAQMNAMQANLLAGGPIYATEAARTTAIPSPFEGQRAYITGSTVAAATGVTTAVPTGIQTIYNGAAWVCVTPVGANSATDATTTATSMVSTLTSDGTAVSVTLATGTTAHVNFGFVGNISTANTVVQSIAVSGATTLAASDANGVLMGASGANLTSHRAMIYTGLTAGTNTFTLNYRTTGGTANFSERWLVAQGIA